VNVPSSSAAYTRMFPWFMNLPPSPST
jgi:hypothetical protein